MGRAGNYPLGGVSDQARRIAEVEAGYQANLATADRINEEERAQSARDRTSRVTNYQTMREAKIRTIKEGRMTTECETCEGTGWCYKTSALAMTQVLCPTCGGSGVAA